MSSKPQIVELDFGMGNIRSLQKAFEHLGYNVTVTEDYHPIEKADILLLPGDGAFGMAMHELSGRGMLEPVIDFYRSGRPVLGICIGFQILFEDSTEFGAHEGLGLLSGSLDKFSGEDLIVPHMGWSPTTVLNSEGLFRDIPDGAYFYYVHSYCYKGQHEFATATAGYGGRFTSVIENNNLFGTQFHPEKSHEWGLKLIQNFMNQAERFL